MILITQVAIGLAIVVLAVAALFALYRLAKGPTGLDRGVASDVIIAVLIAGIATHAIVTRISLGLVVILVLSLLGFTSAVGLARLITRTSARERRFLEAEARAAEQTRDRVERERAEKVRAERDRADQAGEDGDG